MAQGWPATVSIARLPDCLDCTKDRVSGYVSTPGDKCRLLSARLHHVCMSFVFCPQTCRSCPSHFVRCHQSVLDSFFQLSDRCANSPGRSFADLGAALVSFVLHDILSCGITYRTKYGVRAPSLQVPEKEWYFSQFHPFDVFQPHPSKGLLLPAR